MMVTNIGGWSDYLKKVPATCLRFALNCFFYQNRDMSMWLGITDLTTFVLGTIFIVLLPGPNSLYVMTVASRQGVRQGYRGAMGIFAGDTILMLLSVMGAASLLHTMPALFEAFKYAGGAYLGWLGLQLIRGAWGHWQRVGMMPSPQAPTTLRQGDPFKVALMISLMNPKAILFFVSFFIQFVASDYEHPALSFTVLGAIVQLCSAAYLSMLIFSGAGLASYFRQHQRLSALGMALVGTLFVGFGVRLAVAGLG